MKNRTVPDSVIDDEVRSVAEFLRQQTKVKLPPYLIPALARLVVEYVRRCHKPEREKYPGT